MTRAAFYFLLVLITYASIAPSLALSQPSVATSVGPRAGFSLDPDQIVIGGQVSVGPIAPRLMFVPSLELGMGHDRTLVAANFDLQYRIERGTAWRPYVGAGMAVSNETANESEDRLTESHLGGSLIAGAALPAESGRSLFGELKLGMGHGIPPVKFVAGMSFRL